MKGFKKFDFRPLVEVRFREDCVIEAFEFNGRVYYEYIPYPEDVSLCVKKRVFRIRESI